VGGHELRRLLHVLSGWKPDDVEHAIARDDIGHSGRAEQETEVATGFFHSRRTWNAIGGLVTARGRNGGSGRRAAALSSRIGAACGRRHAGRIPRAPSTAGTSFGRHAFTRLPKETSITDGAAPRSESAEGRGQESVGPDDARSRRRQPTAAASVSGAERRVELPLPHDVTEVVVDAVDVVRAAADNGHRHEERDTGCRHTLCETVDASRLVGELRRPLQREAWLRQRRGRDLVVGANPAGALGISQGGEPLRTAPAARLRKGDADDSGESGYQDEKSRCSHHFATPKQ
jgi:hypothetical protein